jgi:hypothetical protein
MFMFVFFFFTHRRRRPAGICDKDTGVGNTFQRARTGAFYGAYSIAATALIQGKRTRGVAAGRPRVGVSRKGFNDGAAEPGAKLTVAQHAVGLIGSSIVGAREVYQRRFIDHSTEWSSKPFPHTTWTPGTRRTAPKSAALVSADAGHSEEEGGDNDGELGHHDAGWLAM